MSQMLCAMQKVKNKVAPFPDDHLLDATKVKQFMAARRYKWGLDNQEDASEFLADMNKYVHSNVLDFSIPGDEEQGIIKLQDSTDAVNLTDKLPNYAGMEGSLPIIIGFPIYRLKNLLERSVHTAPLNFSTKLTLNGTQVKYNLAAVIRRIGTTLDNGHYYVQVKEGDQWWELNNTQTTTISEATVTRTGNEALLFYVKSHISH